MDLLYIFRALINILPLPATFSKIFSPIFLHVSKYCCTFEGEYRKEESLPEETTFEVIPKIGEGYF